jgi:uncharacterized protein
MKKTELPTKRVNLSRSSSFDFSCNRCLRCCTNKKIQVNPYEIARLASNLRISTTAMILDYTDSTGVYLRNSDDGSCIFLDSQGCSVHVDRPLVCRLYPLGRHLDGSGKESFSQMELEPGCESTSRLNNTIEDFLSSQEAAPFIDASGKYLDLLWKLLSTVRGTTSPEIRKAAGSVLAEPFTKEGEHNRLTDIDAVLATCGKPVPTTIEEKMLIHIEMIKALLEGAKGEE